jgi:small subunit ribosomal protein S9
MSNAKQMFSGKRKRAVAKARVSAGKGIVFLNDVHIDNLRPFHKLAILEPLRIYEVTMGEPCAHNFDVTVLGGGKEGQVQAARLAIARALVTITKDNGLKDAFVKYDRHLLVADVRRKEQRKPGDSKARAKRQKSYR